MKDGLGLCRDLNVSTLLIEYDSEVTIKAIRAQKIGNRRLEYPLRDCLQLFSINFEIVHGYPQKNHVADRLAAVAAAHNFNTRRE